MKKTFLSLAFVLSISLAFGAETKPVATENKTVSLNEKSKEISLRESIIQPKKDIKSSAKQKHFHQINMHYNLRKLSTA
jgi:hypothetical protein